MMIRVWGIEWFSTNKTCFWVCLKMGGLPWEQVQTVSGQIHQSKHPKRYVPRWKVYGWLLHMGYYGVMQNLHEFTIGFTWIYDMSGFQTSTGSIMSWSSDSRGFKLSIFGSAKSDVSSEKNTCFGFPKVVPPKVHIIYLPRIISDTIT